VVRHQLLEMSMKHLPLLVVTLLTLNLSTLILAAAKPQDQKPFGAKTAAVAVAPNAQVSKARETIPHNEVILAADPTDPNRLLAGSQINYTPDNDEQSIAYASFDGGKSWSISLERKEAKSAADPAVAFGPGGVAYFATLGEKYIDVLRSLDGGKSWKEPVKVEGNMDRQYLVADCTGGKYRGRLYCNAVLFVDALGGTGGSQNAFGLWSSEDGGTTFGRPAFRVATPPFYMEGMSNSVVLADGTVVSLYHVKTDRFAKDQRAKNPGIKTDPKGNAFLAAARSTDGGNSLLKTMPFISAWNQDQRAGLPVIAADMGSKEFRDWLYVVWSESRPTGHCVMLAVSKDKGATWSKPKRIDDLAEPKQDAKADDALMPNVAVNKAGVVAVSWYDTRGIPNGRGWNVRFRASLDGGETWLSGVCVTEEATDFNGKVAAKGSKFPEGVKQNGPGDTTGMSAGADGVFHPLWIDNRTGIRQVWTAAVTVTPN
jgi:hypothetical protein